MPVAGGCGSHAPYRRCLPQWVAMHPARLVVTWLVFCEGAVNLKGDSLEVGQWHTNLRTTCQHNRCPIMPGPRMTGAPS